MSQIFELFPENRMQRSTARAPSKLKAEKLEPLYVEPELKEMIDDLARLSKTPVKFLVKEMAEKYGLRRRTAELMKEKAKELERGA